MGERGPKPLPANVLRLRAASHVGKSRYDGAVEPDIEIPNPPPHLLPEALEFWKRLTVELEKLGLVAMIDEAALALVVQEYAWLIWHETELQAAIVAAKAARAEFDLEESERRAKYEAAVPKRKKRFVPREWKGGTGFMIPGPQGGAMYNPHWVGRNKHALYLDKFLANFGMSPSSRGRVTQSSSRQLDLPGLNAPTEGFGA
jgi:phage terminase small subunit